MASNDSNDIDISEYITYNEEEKEYMDRFGSIRQNEPDESDKEIDDNKSDRIDDTSNFNTGFVRGKFNLWSSNQDTADNKKKNLKDESGITFEDYFVDEDDEQYNKIKTFKKQSEDSNFQDRILSIIVTCLCITEFKKLIIPSKETQHSKFITHLQQLSKIFENNRFPGSVQFFEFFNSGHSGSWKYLFGEFINFCVLNFEDGKKLPELFYGLYSRVYYCTRCHYEKIESVRRKYVSILLPSCKVIDLQEELLNGFTKLSHECPNKCSKDKEYESHLVLKKTPQYLFIHINQGIENKASFDTMESYVINVKEDFVHFQLVGTVDYEYMEEDKKTYIVKSLISEQERWVEFSRKRGFREIRNYEVITLKTFMIILKSTSSTFN